MIMINQIVVLLKNKCKKNPNIYCNVGEDVVRSVVTTCGILNFFFISFSRFNWFHFVFNKLQDLVFILCYWSSIILLWNIFIWIFVFRTKLLYFRSPILKVVWALSASLVVFQLRLFNYSLRKVKRYKRGREILYQIKQVGSNNCRTG